MPEQRAEVPTPKIDGGALENVLPDRRRASQHHFRILTLDLGVGVVVGVLIAVPERSADIDKAAKPKHTLIEPSAAKCGSVTGLVQGPIEKSDGYTMTEHGRDHPRGAEAQMDEPSEEGDGTKMYAQIDEPEPVGSACKWQQFFA